MKRVNVIYVLVFILISVFQVSAQQIDIKKSNNKVRLHGKPYYIHIVRKSETLYAISQAYNVPVDTIKQDNLHIKDILVVNQFIKVRINKKHNNKQEFVYHEVKKDDTPYNLSIKYSISISDIYIFNPNAKLGIQIGEVLKIPIIKDYTQEIQDTTKIDVTIPDDFIIHIVQKKETIFGIAANYSITQERIKEFNIELNNRPLQIGEEIKIPISNDIIQANDDFYYHKVKKQETIFGICQLYQIKEKELYKNNTDLKKRMLQDGELIKISKNEVSDVFFASQDSTKVKNEELKRDVYAIWKDSLLLLPCPTNQIDTLTTYKVAFFLPLYLNINDTLGKYIDRMVKDENGADVLLTSLRTGRIEDKIYLRSKIFIEFYQGALLALQDLKEKGVSLEVHTFDTQGDSAHVKVLLKEQNLNDFDIFIGPVYGNVLEIVSNYALKNQINIVSPLSIKNSFINNNPYAFQVSPPLEVQMQHASDFLNNIDTKNYIVIHDGNNLDQQYISQFKQQLFAQMSDENFNQIRYNEVFYYDAQDSVLKEVFSPGMQNVVIIPSSDQAFVTDVIGKLNGYSYEFNITIFGQPRWLRFENIELSNFHNTNTHIFSNSYIDYSNPDVIKFVENYRENYNDEPDKFSFQGYDITKYFCLAVNKYGSDFKNCIHLNEVNLLQTNFQFVPYSDKSGYQNTAIYLLEFTKDYKLKKVAQFPN